MDTEQELGSDYKVFSQKNNYRYPDCHFNIICYWYCLGSTTFSVSGKPE